MPKAKNVIKRQNPRRGAKEKSLKAEAGNEEDEDAVPTRTHPNASLKKQNKSSVHLSSKEKKSTPKTGGQPAVAAGEILVSEK